MSSPPPEQFLEWTLQRDWSGMWSGIGVVHFFLNLFVLAILSFQIDMVSFQIGMVPVPFSGGGSETKTIIALVLLGVFILVVVLLVELPKRKLRITRQTITLTDTTILGMKERQMVAAEAKFSAVHFDFLDRLCTYDLYRVYFAYHIEITRNGETFLFPCHDEQEQSQIIKQMRNFLAQ